MNITTISLIFTAILYVYTLLPKVISRPYKHLYSFNYLRTSRTFLQAHLPTASLSHSSVPELLGTLRWLFHLVSTLHGSCSDFKDGMSSQAHMEEVPGYDKPSHTELPIADAVRSRAGTVSWHALIDTRFHGLALSPYTDLVNPADASERCNRNGGAPFESRCDVKIHGHDGRENSKEGHCTTVEDKLSEI